MVVVGWLTRAAARRGAHTAVLDSEKSLTYDELLARARAGAAELARRGVGPGDRVAIALPGSLAFAEALHACLLLGAVVVPVDMRATPSERGQLAGGAALQLDEPLQGPETRSAPGQVGTT